MYSRDLLNQVIKIIETLEDSVGQTGPDTYTAANVEELLYSLREVRIDGERKEIFYDADRDAVGYLNSLRVGPVEIASPLYDDGALAQAWRFFVLLRDATRPASSLTRRRTSMSLLDEAKTVRTLQNRRNRKLTWAA